MNSIFRDQATTRLRPDDLLTKIIGGKSQVITLGFWEAPTGGTPYTMTCDKGTFALAGATIVMKAGRTMQTASSAYAVTGNPAAIKVNRITTLEGRSYLVTGQSLTMKTNSVLLCDSGNFVFIGCDITIKSDTFLFLEPGEFIFDGKNMLFAGGSSPPAPTKKPSFYDTRKNRIIRKRKWALRR